MNPQQNMQRDAITQALINVQNPPPRPSVPTAPHLPGRMAAASTPSMGPPGVAADKYAAQAGGNMQGMPGQMMQPQVQQPSPMSMVGGGAVPSSMPNPGAAPAAPASAPGFAPQVMPPQFGAQ
jgi:hypothetical protein